jgi:hypothetical protein
MCLQNTSNKICCNIANPEFKKKIINQNVPDEKTTLTKKQDVNILIRSFRVVVSKIFRVTKNMCQGYQFTVAENCRDFYYVFFKPV